MKYSTHLVDANLPCGKAPMTTALFRYTVKPTDLGALVLKQAKKYTDIYVIQQDTQRFMIELFVTLDGSTCFRPQWSILRSVYKLCVANLVCGVLRTLCTAEIQHIFH